MVEKRRSLDGTQAVVIILAVPVVLLASFFGLFVLNVLAGRFYPSRGDEIVGLDPDAAGVPVGTLRWVLAVGLMVAFVIVARTRIPDLVKALVLAAAVGVFTASLLVTMYERPALAFTIAGALAVAGAVLMIVRRVPWSWFLAAGEAFALALFYGWPRV